MTTLWGDRKPGDIGTPIDDNTIVIGEPDRVRTPPELGSQELLVAEIYYRKCPCGGEHSAKTFVLEGSDLRVSECLERGFMWWRPRA